MNTSRTLSAAMLALSLFCAAAAPASAASAHNSQIGAAGPTADPYSSSAVQQPEIRGVQYETMKDGGAAGAPCSQHDVRTELERRQCD